MVPVPSRDVRVDRLETVLRAVKDTDSHRLLVQYLATGFKSKGLSRTKAGVDIFACDVLFVLAPEAWGELLSDKYRHPSNGTFGVYDTVLQKTFGDGVDKQRAGLQRVCKALHVEPSQSVSAMTQAIYGELNDVIKGGRDRVGQACVC